MQLTPDEEARRHGPAERLRDSGRFTLWSRPAKGEPRWRDRERHDVVLQSVALARLDAAAAAEAGPVS